MKTMTTKSSSIKIALLSTAIVLAPAAVFAQDPATMPPIPSTQPSNPNQQPPNPGTQDSAGAPGMTGQMMRDKLFLRTAVEANLLQVKLGQLAAQKGSAADVKDLGQKMATDHAEINADLGTVADADGVMVPKKISKEDQAAYDKLNGLSGTAFDTAYITLMVNDHHQDLREYRQEFITATDPTLKDAVLKSAKVIREHTMMVDKLATDRGIPVPAHKMPPPPTPPSL
jgi:putative membrane protein